MSSANSSAATTATVCRLEAASDEIKSDIDGLQRRLAKLQVGTRRATIGQFNRQFGKHVGGWLVAARAQVCSDSRMAMAIVNLARFRGVSPSAVTAADVRNTSLGLEWASESIATAPPVDATAPTHPAPDRQHEHAQMSALLLRADVGDSLGYRP